MSTPANTAQGTQSKSLDQIVKGAPSPHTTVSAVAASAVSPASPSPALAASIHESKKPSLAHAAASADDPESSLPSSPSQIYLNLLILEASLRSQYLTLRARRRQHTFFLLLLSLWIAWFFYGLFLRPREDGKGIGGSVYWVVDMTEKVAFMGGILTLLLLWATGQWERGVRWPRRWIAVTNRGLRGMNLKIVVLRGPWWSRILDQCSLIFPYKSLFGRAQGSEFRVVDFPTEKMPQNEISRHGYTYRGGTEEDVAPGGDSVKLLLLPKQFSPEFRENWELYRNEYWERENERRANLRRHVRAREREIAKAQGGWLWWTGWRGWASTKSKLPPHLDNTSHLQTRPSSNPSTRGVVKEQKRRRPSNLHSGSHSRSSSRSSTVTPEPEDLRGLSTIPDPSARTHRRIKSHHLVTSSATISSSSSSHQKSSSRPSTSLADITGHATSGNHTLHKRASTLSNASSSSANESEISERSTTSTSGGLGASGVSRPRQRDLAMTGVEEDDDNM